MDSLQIEADMSDVAYFIGKGLAMCESGDDADYLDDVIRAAFGTAEQEFNLQAVAMGKTGAIKHMFEWGTVGINRHKSDIRPNPMSDQARLWETVVEGHGITKTLTFYYLPSVATVPKPTSRETGMDPSDIEMLEDHVFEWKAMVFEEGTPVTIEPINAKRLIMPFYKGVIPSTATAADIARGYTMGKGPYTFVPGQDVAGNFVAFFTEFWEGEGNTIVNADVIKQIEFDYLLPMEENAEAPMITTAPTSTFDILIKKRQKEIAYNAKRRADRARKNAMIKDAR